MSFQQFNGSLNILSRNEIAIKSLLFSDDSEQTSAFIPANQTPDLYGVQMLNLLSPPVNIYSSCEDLTLLGNQNEKDDAWIVFPNWSCRLYQSTNYGTADPTSELMTNDTDYPVLYYNHPRGDAYYQLGRPIVDSTGEDGYLPLITQSIKVYYNGVEKTIAGLS
jgi:hypothetical protein